MQQVGCAVFLYPQQTILSVMHNTEKQGLEGIIVPIPNAEAHETSKGKARTKKLALVEMQKDTSSPFEGQLVTNSFLVAEKFGKRHDHVLRDIKNLTTQNWGVKNMFVETTYLNERKQRQPMFMMNRDGFSLLVMGFTGAEALQFKLDFIAAFNKMEGKLRKQLYTRQEVDVITARISQENEAWGREKLKLQIEVERLKNVVAKSKLEALAAKRVSGEAELSDESFLDALFATCTIEEAEEALQNLYFDYTRLLLAATKHATLASLVPAGIDDQLYFLRQLLDFFRGMAGKRSSTAEGASTFTSMSSRINDLSDIFKK
jgi:Rha family phage regulatory protein